MNASFSGHDVRILLQAQSTQLMLSDAIVGLVSKGIYLAAKYGALTKPERDSFLQQLDHVVGLDDITEAIEPLRFRYDFVTNFGETRRGPMTQLVRATIDHAKSQRASRPDLLLLKDYSFTYRELAPLFEMLREARNYFAHETADRHEIGWNGLLISALTRILERGNFLDKQRVEERAKLKAKAKELLLELAGISSADSQPDRPNDAPYEDHEQAIPDEKIVEDPANNSEKVLEVIQLLSGNQDELLSKSHSVDVKLTKISDQLASLLANPANMSAGKPKQEEDSVDDSPVELDEEVAKASEVLISVDTLYERLQDLRDQIKDIFGEDSRWRGPSTNLLQRAIITAIVVNEPATLADALTYDDVKWRISKDRELTDEQVGMFGKQIDELLSKTAWPREYQD